MTNADVLLRDVPGRFFVQNRWESFVAVHDDKAAREQAGLTQQDVADKLKRPQSFVAKYEQAERRLDVVEFIQIARVIGVEPTKLFAQVLKRK